MIDFLYSMTRKGWLKALSFTLATVMFVLILLNSIIFARYFGGSIPYLAILVFYGMAILWIHGIGFEIRTLLFRMIFMPIVGYLIIIPSTFYFILNK